MSVEANASLQGLTSSQVLEQRRLHGENVLPKAKGATVWSILLDQFKNPLVYIILFAAAVSLAVGELSDFVIIMAVVVVDAILGFIQEYRAQRTYAALRSLLKPTTTVIRDGERQEIEVRELVPGDLVVLNSGERVPGDGCVLQATKVTVDEAILTGESEPVAKQTVDPNNRMYMGTTVVTGRGLMQVERIAAETELGQIATSLKEETGEQTPLQVRLQAFSRVLTRLVALITAAIFVTGIISGRPLLDMVRVSIILAIAAVPEGLLIAVTVILVVGMRKILQRNGLVKRLLAVETLGSVTVICTDKTGTLTEGRMRVIRADLRDGDRALQTMVLCNDLEGPVDVALWEYARAQLGDDPERLVDRAPRLEEELFTSESKFMISANRLDGGTFDYLKGAPEIVLGMCDLEPGEAERVLAQVERWAGEGLRLLGLACREHGALDRHSGYRWLGLLAMDDPVRDGVHDAIQVARQAGIQVKMITGDYQLTAERIAANLGLATGEGRVIDGDELSRLADEELAKRVKQITVFARIRPRDKLRIVRALQENGEVAAMVGDGVNDAPALKRANIGVVVGSATDVAKETADLILLDSNFKTIVAAIEEGRVIFENIRKVVAYVLSNSFAEVTLVFGAMLLGWPAPLAVAQILWIHLICDGPADIVLGFEPKEPGIMQEKPKSVKEPILTRLGLSLIAVISLTSALLGLYVFGHHLQTHNTPVVGQSIAFASFAVNSMIYIFAYRSLRRSILRGTALSENPPLIWSVLFGLALAVGAFWVPGIRNLLGIVPLTLQQWAGVFAVALFLLSIVEVAKWLANRRQPSLVVDRPGG